MGMIGYFAEIDSEKINQLLESAEKPLMDNIHDTLSGLRRLDIDKRWDFLHFGLTGTSAFDPAKNDPLSRAVLGEPQPRRWHRWFPGVDLESGVSCDNRPTGSS